MKKLFLMVLVVALTHENFSMGIGRAGSKFNGRILATQMTMKWIRDKFLKELAHPELIGLSVAICGFNDPEILKRLRALEREKKVDLRIMNKPQDYAKNGKGPKTSHACMLFNFANKKPKAVIADIDHNPPDVWIVPFDRGLIIESDHKKFVQPLEEKFNTAWGDEAFRLQMIQAIYRAEKKRAERRKK